MADDTGGEKTLPASAQKIRRAREKGNIAKSQDLGSGLALMTALFAMFVFGGHSLRSLVAAGTFYFGNLHEVSPANEPVQTMAMQALYFVASAALPFSIVMVVVGFSFNVMQVGVLFTAKPMQPKFNRLNPISGAKRFASLRSLMELAKSLSKLGVVAVIVWFSMRGRLPDFIGLMTLSPAALVSATAAMIVTLWWRIALAMILIGLIDFAYQRWQHGQDLRMTHQEVKQETKELEGDPNIKRRVRQLQRQIATQRMMSGVPEADVIITNPTMYAVALRYDLATMASPVVIAKGMRLVAERIREIGVENGVPIVQKPELARALYRAVEIGDPISEDLFRAVAEVLSFVYSIDRRAEKIRERRDMINPAQAPVSA